MMQRVLFGALLSATICLQGLGDETVKPRGRIALERCDKVELELRGPVNDKVRLVSSNWLIRAPRDNPAIFTMFADRDVRPHDNLLPWSGEFAGKHLTSLVQVLRVTHDPKLRKAGEDFVARLIALQADDGYLGPYPRDARLTGKAPNCDGPTWDLWSHYHIMMGLLLWHEETGDPKSLETARRIGDLLCEKFLATEKPAVSSVGSTEMNQAIVHSLARLYRYTGDKKHLELAEKVVADFAAPGAGDYLRMALNGTNFYQLPKPRWESLHPIMGLAELYAITDQEDYRRAFENLWWSIVATDRHNNGGFSSGEQAQGNPYHQGPIETCCTIAWMAMSVEMLRLTGDSRVADELELSTFNQVLGSFSPDCRWGTYNTPMDGRRVPSTRDIAFQIRKGSEELNCCSVNAPRGFGLLSEWALMRDGAGLVLNWYGPSKLTTTVDSTAVTLSQDTDYPKSGHVVIEVEPAEPKEFELKLRIPHWSSTRVSVNGEPQVATSGKYLPIKRRWKKGDIVTIDLDMSLRYWTGERECEGKTSIYRGPILLVLDGSKESAPEYKGDWETHGPMHSTRAKDATVTFKFEGDAIEWHGALFDDAGKASVTIDGREIESVNQFGPQRGAPFVWRRAGLGSGKHTIKVENLGEKPPESSNVWINASKFVAPTEVPTFDANELAKGSFADLPGTIVALDVQDREGRTVRLRDFATAGHSANYFSWLRVLEAPSAPFSKENPSRTATVRK